MYELQTKNVASNHHCAGHNESLVVSAIPNHQRNFMRLFSQRRRNGVHSDGQKCMMIIVQWGSVIRCHSRSPAKLSSNVFQPVATIASMQSLIKKNWLSNYQQLLLLTQISSTTIPLIERISRFTQQKNICNYLCMSKSTGVSAKLPFKCVYGWVKI